MSQELSFLKQDFPEDWKSDTRMNFLFSPFRERCVNPEGYDAKLTFWMNAIQNLCLKSSSPIISQVSLSSALERKLRQPSCLDVVLENMIRQGLIMNLSEYNRLEVQKGWLGWGFDVLVQKPVSWGFSSVQSLLNWNKKDDNFVVLSVVKDLASKLLQRYNELVNSKWTDNAVFLEDLRQECKDICSESNFQFTLIQLQKEKKALVFEQYEKKVIKFRKLEEKAIEPLSELDKGVLSLKRARDTITEDLDVLDEKILSFQEAAKSHVQKGQKTKAMLFLKKKKRLEAIMTKKSIALDNIENMLCQLKNAGSEKMVLDAYRTGVLAMKGVTSAELDLDTADEVMADVKEALDDYSEIQNTLGKSVGDDSLEEYEDELNEILSEENEQNVAENRRLSPPRPSDEELLKRLEALRAPPEDVPPVKKKALNKPLRAP